MQPVQCFVCFFSDQACELRIPAALRNLHHVFVEFIYGVTGFKLLFLLHLGVDAKHEACRVNGVTRSRTHLFENNRFQAVLGGADCGDDTADTQTTDDKVIFLLRKSSLFFSSRSAHSGSAHGAGQRGEDAAFKNRTTRCLHKIISPWK